MCIYRRANWGSRKKGGLAQSSGAKSKGRTCVHLSGVPVPALRSRSAPLREVRSAPWGLQFVPGPQGPLLQNGEG